MHGISNAPAQHRRPASAGSWRPLGSPPGCTARLYDALSRSHRRLAHDVKGKDGDAAGHAPLAVGAPPRVLHRRGLRRAVQAWLNAGAAACLQHDGGVPLRHVPASGQAGRQAVVRQGMRDGSCCTGTCSLSAAAQERRHSHPRTLPAGRRRRRCAGARRGPHTCLGCRSTALGRDPGWWCVPQPCRAVGLAAMQAACAPVLTPGSSWAYSRSSPPPPSSSSSSHSTRTASGRWLQKRRVQGGGSARRLDRRCLRGLLAPRAMAACGLPPLKAAPRLPPPLPPPRGGGAAGGWR